MRTAQSRRRLWIGVTCLLLWVTSCSVTHVRPAPRLTGDPTLDAYGQLPAIEHVALSPDGSRIAVVRNAPQGRFVVIASLADGASLGTVRASDAKLRSIQWVDDDHLLLTTSVTGVPKGLIGMPGEWSMLQTYDVGSRALSPLLDHAGVDESPDGGGSRVTTLNTSYGPTTARHVDGATVLFVHGYYVTDRTLPGLFRIDLKSGKETLVERGPPQLRGWLVDDTGRAVVEELYNGSDQRWSVRVRDGSGWREAASGHDPYADKRLVGFGPTDGSVLVTTGEGSEAVWTPVSLVDGSLGAPIENGTTWNGILRNPATDRVLGGQRAGEDRRYVFFDPALEERWNSVRQTFEGDRVRPVSMSRDATKLVVLVDDPHSGEEYKFVDFNQRSVVPLGSVYEDLGPVSEVRSLTYPAADGLEIAAYLTLPTGPTERLPLIVMPHGGPADHDTGEFDWWAQALAAQGYAVLQPNFRGSDVDPKLLEAGFGEFGRKMQSDLSDGVRALAQDGTIDPTRVCIVGASYGGYAALAGVALQTGVYRCGVAVAGISDLPRFLSWVDQHSGGRSNASERYWNRFMGITGADDPKLAAISPIAHADVISAPLLLIHGHDDTVVPFEQSEILAETLERAGKPVELVALDHEDHWLSRSDTRMQMLQTCVAFLRANNPPGVAH